MGQVENKNKPKKKFKKRFIVIIIIILVIIAAVLGMGSKFKNAQMPVAEIDNSIPVKVSTLTQRDMIVTAPLTGRIQPIEDASIIPLISGKVTSVNVDLGYKVSKGDILFEIDKDQLQNTYNQALAGYDIAKVSYDNALINFNRNKQLYSESAISKLQYEQSEMQYNSSLQGLNQANASLSSALDALNNHKVSAPIDGFITSVNINKGEVASQGMASMTIANIDQVIIETSVSESLINKINLNDEVQVKVSSVSEELFKGTISALSPAPAQNTLTYPLKVSLNNEDTLIKSGMFAEVIIISEKHENVIAVPSDAVIVNAGKTVLIGVNDDMSVTFIPVETGIDDGTFVEITNEIPGDISIVIEGQQYVNIDSEVNIVE